MSALDPSIDSRTPPVRQLARRRAPTAIVGDDAPVFMSLATSYEELRRIAGPGRYRIEVCDERGVDRADADAIIEEAR